RQLAIGNELVLYFPPFRTAYYDPLCRNPETEDQRQRGLQPAFRMRRDRGDLFGRVTYAFCSSQFRSAFTTLSKPAKRFLLISFTATIMVRSVTTSAARSAARCAHRSRSRRATSTSLIVTLSSIPRILRKSKSRRRRLLTLSALWMLRRSPQPSMMRRTMQGQTGQFQKNLTRCYAR